jgi:hypothetical protein
MLFKVTTLFSLVLLLGYDSAVAWATGLDGASDMHGFNLASGQSSDAKQLGDIHNRLSSIDNNVVPRSEVA